jgi:isocitrate dehydrogenase
LQKIVGGVCWCGTNRLAGLFFRVIKHGLNAAERETAMAGRAVRYAVKSTQMSEKTAITVAYGDGIGPEIMEASLHIIQSAGAALEIEKIEIGEKVYLSGNSAGIDPSGWESLRRTKVFYKAPITTPQGGGFKSLNVTTRKKLSDCK